MKPEKWTALSVVVLIVALLAALMLITGCCSPPRKIVRYEARLWIELPNGKMIEADDWGYTEE